MDLNDGITGGGGVLNLTEGQGQANIDGGEVLGGEINEEDKYSFWEFGTNGGDKYSFWEFGTNSTNGEEYEGEANIELEGGN